MNKKLTLTLSQTVYDALVARIHTVNASLQEEGNDYTPWTIESFVVDTIREELGLPRE